LLPLPPVACKLVALHDLAPAPLLLLAPDGVRTLALLTEADAICKRLSMSCMVVMLIAAFHRSKPSVMLSDDELRAADELTPAECRDPASGLALVPLLAAAADADAGAQGLPSEDSTPAGRGDSRSRVAATSVPTLPPAVYAAPDFSWLTADPLLLWVGDGLLLELLPMGAVSIERLSGR
jgi:hypothetical protein